MLKPTLCLAVVISALAPGLSWGQTQLPDFANATLEELMNIEVTSVSRRQERVEDVAASIYVISRDEIRRSGLTSIAEVLRLAPGVQVSRLNGNKWSVSVRGFNSLVASKLLVMIDGRSIYNPAYSAVFWDTEDVMLEDVERIEVIRGPGGAMWGANAINGVINVITRSSSETRGGLARVTAGTFDTTGAAFRYGGGMGALTYRAFAQASAHGESLQQSGGKAGDNWHSVTGGLRADWTGGPRAAMFQAATTVGQQRPLWVDPTSQTPDAGTLNVTDTRVSHALLRWTQTNSSGGALQLQGYFDENLRDEFIGTYRRHTYDIDGQYTTAIGRRHALVTGGGYRYLTESIGGNGPYSFTPDRVRPMVANAFAQDSVAFAGGRAEVTVGAKYEYSTSDGAAFQPNARVMWKVASQQRVWAAVARAIRNPSLVDRGLGLELPPMPGPNGLAIIAGIASNPNLENESLLNVEAGYRVNAAGRISLDAVAFGGRYNDLQTQEPPTQPTFALVNGVPTLFAMASFQNLQQATTTGAEVIVRGQITPAWEADVSMSAFRMATTRNGSLDTHSSTIDGDTAARQWRVHSGWSLGTHRHADLRLIHVGALRAAGVPAYTRLDARLEWGLTSQLSIIGDGQNLLSRSHIESATFTGALVTTRIPRSGNLGLVWRF
jgi:iron complex outermembrane recepter protein